MLGWTLRATPLLHASGIDEVYIPSAALTLSTVVLGFFSVMLAGEVREQHRKWSYMATALLLTLLLLARVYLGMDWLSGALVGILLGFTWTAIVGIAYRLRSSHTFSGTVASGIFFGTLLTTMAWQVGQRLEQDVDSLQLALPQKSLSYSEWWASGWQSLPRERTRFESVAAREFNAQLAIPLHRLEQALLSKGWEASPAATWQWTMRALNPSPDIDSLPLLSKDYLGHEEVLKLRFRGPRPDRQLTVRVWDSGTRLMPAQQPLYLAQMSDEVLDSRLAFLSYWRALPVGDQSLQKLLGDLVEFESRTENNSLLLFRLHRFTENGELSPAAVRGAEPDH
jgi:hypothetical protein